MCVFVPPFVYQHVSLSGRVTLLLVDTRVAGEKCDHWPQRVLVCLARDERFSGAQTGLFAFCQVRLEMQNAIARPPCTQPLGPQAAQCSHIELLTRLSPQHCLSRASLYVVLQRLWAQSLAVCAKKHAHNNCSLPQATYQPHRYPPYRH